MESTVVDPDMEELFNLFLEQESEPWDSREPDTDPTVCIAGNPEDCPRILSEKQPFHFQIRDTSHKSFYLQDNILVATNLQGDNAAVEEKVTVVPNRHLERKRCPLILGVQGGSKGLSCGNDGQPQLQLEDVQLLNLFHQEKEAKCFTFYKTYNGSTHSFEAAAYPGWFLCTSTQVNKPISLTMQLGQSAITDFYFQRK
ncbi:interleukin-36 receptor antagonist protein-like [Carettochelys insculpta]|uniref:interleukin-36 receptor antagonist protein-like n=1 Tax=Carettochelys insculpta TaxID=44489 RepID=UPI003EB7B27C